VSHRIHAECRLVQDDESREPREHQGAPQIAEQNPHERGQYEPRKNRERRIAPVLEHNERISGQVIVPGHRCALPLLVENPAHVRPPESFLNIVRISIGIRIPMMPAVVNRPLEGGILELRSSKEEKEYLERSARAKACMRKKSVVAAGNAKAARYKPKERDAERGPRKTVQYQIQRGPDNRNQVDTREKNDIQPVQGRAMKLCRIARVHLLLLPCNMPEMLRFLFLKNRCAAVAPHQYIKTISPYTSKSSTCALS
jgi:hypothetical protein